uniref:Uncharacterized protein n=1 Tax=Arundo donax TaxID=35708 RepID=A0A0A9D6T2_ARUDO
MLLFITEFAALILDVAVSTKCDSLYQNKLPCRSAQDSF